MASLLTERQTKDMHDAVRAYLTSQGATFRATLESFTREDPHCKTDDEPIPQRSHNLLARKWTSVVRLQRKVMQLEAKLKQAEEDLKHAGKGIAGVGGGKDGRGGGSSSSSSSSLTLPREPAKNTLEGHRGPITCVAMHPTFNLVVSSSEDASIKVWDYESGEFEKTLKGHTNSVNALCFDARGETLASCSSDLSIKLWDFQNDFKCRKTLTGHEHTVSGVCFVPTSEHLVSCSRDMSIRIWEINTGYCIHTHNGGHNDWVRGIAVSPDGTMVASCSSDQTAKVWSLETQGTTSASVTELVALRDHDHVVECVAFSNAASDLTLRKLMRKGDMMTATTTSGVEIGTNGQGETKTSADGGVGAAQKQARNRGGQFVVTGSRDRTVRVWHVGSGTSICIFRDHENWVRGVQFHSGGHVVVSVGEDRTIRAFDLKEGRKSVRTISDAHSHFLTSFDMSSAGSLMVTGSVDKTLKCWKLK